MPRRLFHLPRAVLTRLRDMFPTSCALCGSDHDDAVCDSCSAQHFSGRQHRCEQCAAPLPAMMTATTCGQCLKAPPAFDATIVATDYAPPVDQLVLALKFGNRLELAPLLARMLHGATRSAQTPLPVLLTAVPLGAGRLAERGFNQSLEIARPLSRALCTRLDERLVARTRDTRAQALLHPDERDKNIRNAFVVPAHKIDLVRGQHIGVIDDVMTTGETLNELAATLKRFGASRITNLVFARTAQH